MRSTTRNFHTCGAKVRQPAGTRDVVLPESIQRLFEACNRHCERLGGLVEEILDLEKLAAGQMRFKATTLEGGVVNNDGYCTNAASGPNTIQLGSLIKECWVGGVDLTPLGTPVQLVALQWQVATVPEASMPFDFCIENLTAITAP